MATRDRTTRAGPSILAEAQITALALAFEQIEGLVELIFSHADVDMDVGTMTALTLIQEKARSCGASLCVERERK